MLPGMAMLMMQLWLRRPLLLPASTGAMVDRKTAVAPATTLEPSMHPLSVVARRVLLCPFCLQLLRPFFLQNTLCVVLPTLPLSLAILKLLRSPQLLQFLSFAVAAAVSTYATSPPPGL